MPPSVLRPRRAPGRRPSRARALALGGTAVAAAAGFGAVARAAATRATADVDEALRERPRAPEGHPARRGAHAVAAPGKWWVYVPAALGVAGYLLRAPAPRGAGALAQLTRFARGVRGAPPRSRGAGAGAVVLASALAAALGPAFDRWLPQPPAPPGHASRRDPVFPSGHALGPTAFALASAYVLTRESLAPPAVAIPLALAYPLASAGGKLVEERHWASDVLGGSLAGIAVAAGCLALYELADG